jgi:hypothetical protein
MAKTVEQYQADIESGKLDAKEIYEDFEKHTKKHVAQLELVCSLVIPQPVSSERDIA